MQTKLTLALLLATLPAMAQTSPDNSARQALIDSLNKLAAQQTAARRETVARIRTKAQAEQRQTDVRRKMLSLLGPLPEKTPLNPKITGNIPLDGFHIEKLTYESQPGFHVTAVLYLPDNPKAKLPAIVVAPGHGPTGKASDFAFASTFARNGFAVLSYDPLGQGERLQYPDPPTLARPSPRAPPASTAKPACSPRSSANRSPNTCCGTACVPSTT